MLCMPCLTAALIVPLPSFDFLPCPAASSTLEGVVILRENPDYVEQHE